MSTIGIHKREIHGISTLEVVPKDMESKPLPCVIYFHGFTSAKEQNLPFAHMLAERGYRVLLPDSLYHGERYKAMSEQDFQLSFWDIVKQNIAEGDVLYLYLQENELLLDNRIGVAGTSMGGITASSMLAKYDWIQAIGVFMGTAKTTTYAKMQLKQLEKEGVTIPDKEIQEIIQSIEATDLSKQLEKMNDKPVFMWHGEKDAVIPFELAKDFYTVVKKLGNAKVQIDFKQDKQAGHKVSRDAFLAGKDWFEKNL